MTSEFEHAPPPTPVDGLTAAAMSIQRLDGSMVFDADTSSCDVDVTVDFKMGPDSGSPFFDLRQTVDEAWLDGAALPLSQIGPHDFGGGADAELRIIEPTLSAHAEHRLRLRYGLGQPDALATSSGPPIYSWNGDRLTLKFWYTDLRAGRYLDAWLPGNLLFDPFPVALDVRVINTETRHRLITNGESTDAGSNHWIVSFPSWFTVCSGMLRVQPSDELVSAARTISLPDGTSLDVHAHKPTGSTVNLATQLTAIEAMLADNVTNIGPYAHGDRFTAVFDGSGGMEYAGACRSSLGALRHEVYHSWWGRGIQPATQNDGWWDEAWTVYKTASLSPAPLNFALPPVTLSSQNPFQRETPGASYSAGADVFQGMASLVGAGVLDAQMNRLYADKLRELATTIDVESAILAGSPTAAVVDGFHRFVYGFEDPVEPSELWLRDDPAHTGAEAWGGRFWDSPDLWIRHDPDDVEDHQAPASDRDNWIYARVRNRGAAARHFMVAFNVKPWAGTEFIYPGDYLPAVAATGGFELGPGQSRIVKAKWPRDRVPPAGTHGCLLAAALARFDEPAAGRHVWEDNNLAQKNLTIVELPRDGWVVLPVVVGHLELRARDALRLRIDRPKGWTDVPATLLVHRKARERKSPDEVNGTTERTDCGGFPLRRAPVRKLTPWTSASKNSWAEAYFADAEAIDIEPGPRIDLPLESLGGYPSLIALRLRVPPESQPGSCFRLDLVELDRRKRPVGGVSIRVHIN